jgi:hypothetical protein
MVCFNISDKPVNLFTKFIGWSELFTQCSFCTVCRHSTSRILFVVALPYSQIVICDNYVMELLCWVSSHVKFTENSSSISYECKGLLSQQLSHSHESDMVSENEFCYHTVIKSCSHLSKIGDGSDSTIDITRNVSVICFKHHQSIKT